MTTVTSEIAALEEKLGRLKILQPKQLRCDYLKILLIAFLLVTS
jgi:hypothetical protein